ncbi:AraC family transcriptional regulator [Paenibacillus aestuarii]|uniref:AraC family transcriptional regulator n=1 Tax=Paenibacillus aestuarii TaxID=516965 RepID=A0ABW0KAH1_9BACL|nr:AraC family transcriptional regulator [Paenibacillus aestuarii]
MNSRLFPLDLLERDLHPHVVAYYFKQWNGFQMPFHRHDAAEIMYAMTGSCIVEIREGTAQPECVSLKKGEFIMLDANVPHRLLVDEATPCRMLNLEFRFRDSTGVLPSIRQLAGAETVLADLLQVAASYLVLRDPDEVYHLMKSLVLELDKSAVRSETMVQLLMAQLLIRIARLRTEAPSGGLPQSEHYVWMSKAYMHQNYDRDIQVKDIASAVSLHPGYLQRIFKLHTGRTLTAYLTNIRMEKAKMLLHETDIPITEICDFIGVGSRQYFHLLFKGYTDQTPLEYRKSMHAQRWDYPV